MVKYVSCLKQKIKSKTLNVNITDIIVVAHRAFIGEKRHWCLCEYIKQTNANHHIDKMDS